MNILSEEARVEREGRMSCAVRTAETSVRQRRPADEGASERSLRHMRKLGFVLCIGSALITLASAAYLAITL